MKRRNSVPIFLQLYRNLNPIDASRLRDTISDELEKRLLIGIIEGEYSNDKEACSSIFGSSTSTEYNRIKSELRRKLVQKLIEIEVNRSANFSFSNAFKKVNKDYAAFNILSKSAQGASASYLGELIVSNSIKYDFNDFIVPVCSYLVEYYSIYSIDRNKAERYLKLMDDYAHSTNLEILARRYYSQLMNLFIIEFAPGEKAFKLASKYLKILEEHLQAVPSTNFHLYTYLILVFKYYSIKDFQNMHKSAIAGYKYFNKLEYKRPGIENTFLRKSVEANLVLGDFHYCSNQLGLILKNAKPGKSNWYNTLEIIITLKLHQSKYPSAVQSFFLGKKHRNFNSLLITIKTRWGLLEAYINFLQRVGVAPESPTMSRFRINRFINNTPQYEEDKKGRNIQLIIAQLLFYILDKNWDKMEEKIDALQKYGARYLRKNELFRSQVFIKMLLEIPRRMYHPKAIIRHTAKYRKRLEEMAPNIDLNGSTLEIIPYEHLWELIIQNIVPPKYMRKSKMASLEA